MENKIRDLKKLIEIRGQLKLQGKQVVFTNGCFDLLHQGHIYLLKKAKELGDVLIVAVNDDTSVSRLKGLSRPIFPLEERLEILEAIAVIDYLVSFSEETPLTLISSLLPDVLVKGGDWKPEEVVGKTELEASGGKVIIIPYLPSHSTSDILKRITNLGYS